MSSSPKSACPYTDDIDTVMSNFDRGVEPGTDDRLKAEDVFGFYAGWDFNGRVWWDREAATYHCEVWRYGSPLEVLSAETLPEVMRVVSDVYGYR